MVQAPRLEFTKLLTIYCIFLSILTPGANVIILFYHGNLLHFLGIAVILRFKQYYCGYCHTMAVYYYGKSCIMLPTMENQNTVVIYCSNLNLENLGNVVNFCSNFYNMGTWGQCYKNDTVIYCGNYFF
jgi:hypothetical protein